VASISLSAPGDTFGKISTQSLAGFQYFMILKNDSTSFRIVHFAKAKNEACTFFKDITKIE
jgi:hypothetical protein